MSFHSPFIVLISRISWRASSRSSGADISCVLWNPNTVQRFRFSLQLLLNKYTLFISYIPFKFLPHVSVYVTLFLRRIYVLLTQYHLLLRSYYLWYIGCVMKYKRYNFCLVRNIFIMVKIICVALLYCMLPTLKIKKPIIKNFYIHCA
jgi:hypothetical protein